MISFSRPFPPGATVTAAIFAAILATGCRTAPLSQERHATFQHVVVCWLKTPGDARAQDRIIEASKKLSHIPGVFHISVGRVVPSSRSIVDSTFDVALIVSFPDRAAMNSYLVHPDHQKATEQLLQPLTRRIVVYDFIEE